jgi:hypothetical protein
MENWKDGSLFFLANCMLLLAYKMQEPEIERLFTTDFQFPTPKAFGVPTLHPDPESFLDYRDSITTSLHYLIFQYSIKSL